MRADGKGHWPKGKRRNQQNEVAASIFRLAKRRLGLGCKSLAKLLSVSPKAIWNYRNGMDFPSDKVMQAIIDKLVPMLRRE